MSFWDTLSRVCLFSQIVICERLVGLVSFETNVSETAGQIHLRDIVRCKEHSHLSNER